MRYIMLVFILSVIALAGSELDLPILPPTDSRRDQYEKPSPVELPTPTVTVVEEEPDPPVFFGEEINTTESLVYVLDFSQSMSSPFEKKDLKWLNRWEVVQREASRSISKLSQAIRFGIVVFGTGRACGLEQWKPELVPASGDNKALAIAWIYKFENVSYYGGATPTGPAVVAGLGYGSDAMILLTDGEPSFCGMRRDIVPYITHRNLIKAQNTRPTPIDVFGIGLPTEEARKFCRNVASDSTGTFVELR